MNIEEKKLPLLEKLQTAVELEFSTIPPYLTAMFSIKPGENPEAAQIIRSVFMEEMLHMVLAANCLSALGGKLKLDETNIPSYPCRLKFNGKNFKNREFDVHLAAFSKDTIEVFRQIELPEFLNAPQVLTEITIEGFTIGEFYNSIKTDLQNLCKDFVETDVFNGNRENQVSEQYYWSGGGKPIVVTNLEQALKAIDIVIEQGEGTSGLLSDGDALHFQQQPEIPHYFRFNEIYMQRRYSPSDKPQDDPSGVKLSVDYSKVFPIKLNCKSTDFAAGSNLQMLNDSFNKKYSTMLYQIAEGFNGNPRVFYTAIMNGMQSLTPIALKMVQIPISDNIDAKHGSPSFEWLSEQI